MQGTEGHSLPDGIGCAVIERQPLETLRHLWDGPLEPLELERIEMSLRAIITGHTLVVARFHDVWDDLDVDDVVNGSGELAPVFSDFLDYEFISPDEPQPFRHPESSLEKQDESSLVESVCISLGEKAVSVLPKWISRRSEAFAFWDAWYRGEPRGECERSARIAGRTDEQEVAFDPDESIHPIFHKSPADHAKYLLGCYRAGAVVYSVSPLAEICPTLSRWPEELFAPLNDELKERACLLPPLVGIVMSRAKHRKQIPEVIRDMRTEYGEARDKLWDLFKNAWGTYEQLRYVRIDLFPNLLAKLTAATLYHDFCASRNLFDSRHILGQHLTDAEQRAFGLRQ